MLKEQSVNVLFDLSWKACSHIWLLYFLAHFANLQIYEVPNDSYNALLVELPRNLLFLQAEAMLPSKANKY